MFQELALLPRIALLIVIPIVRRNTDRQGTAHCLQIQYCTKYINMGLCAQIFTRVRVC